LDHISIGGKLPQRNRVAVEAVLAELEVERAAGYHVPALEPAALQVA
jgi:hypothetical protein